MHQEHRTENLNIFMVEAAAEPAGLALESLLKFINISLEA